MSGEIHTDTENYTIEVDEEIGAIIHTWDRFAAGEQFRAGAGELLEVIRQEDKAKLIVNVSGIRAHDQKDKQWLQEEWIPEIIDAGIEYSVTVHSDSVISEMEIGKFVDQAADLPFTYVMAGDMSEARQWLVER